MVSVAILRTARDRARGFFFAARDAYYAAIDACAANYSREAWDRIGEAEAVFRTARARMDAADADFERAELAAVGIKI